MVDDPLLRRARAEFLEMPGLRLTRKQAQRLWALDEATCARLLAALSDLGFLTCAADGQYSRRTEGAESPSGLKMAKLIHPNGRGRLAS